jgi:hypothetical protein
MNELTDTVLYNVTLGSTISTIKLYGYAGYDAEVVADLPIVSYARGPQVSLQSGALFCAPVTNLNPCAANDALVADSVPTNDGFFDQVSYRGAFSSSYNWLAGWTAADEYGFVDTSVNTEAFEISGVDTGITFSFPTQVGLTYTIQRATTVDGTYDSIGMVTGDGSQMSYIDTAALAGAFYKVSAE